MKIVQETNKVMGVVNKILLITNTQQIVLIKSNSNSVKVVINNPEKFIALNDSVVISGKYEKHFKYGVQFISNDIELVSLTKDLLIGFLTTGSGIGDKIAKRLIDELGDQLLPAIENYDIAKLSSVERVSNALATSICLNFHRTNGKIQFINWVDTVLKKQSITDNNDIKKTLMKAFEFYGLETIKKIKSDPYRVWAFSSFKHAEVLAQALLIAKDDKRRLICAVEDVLFKELSTGSTNISPLVFQRNLEGLVGKELTILAIYHAMNSASDKFPRFVVTTPIGAENLSKEELLYAKKFAIPSIARMENYVSQQIKIKHFDNLKKINFNESDLNNYRLSSNHKLSTSQQDAVKMVLSNGVSAVSGGGGTGKTSVLECVTDIIEQSGINILQIALSGKAAQRLQEQTGKVATTIEYLLLLIESAPNYLDQFSEPLLLIDEASMIDLQAMYRILKVLENRLVRIVFVGDWAQLAPVGLGLIFHKIMQSSLISKIELLENFRSTPEIKISSDSIKNGDNIIENEYVRLIQCSNIDEMYSSAIRQYELHLHNQTTHIIAATKKTVSSLNISLHQLLMIGRKPIKCAPHFRVGDKVIYKRNELKQLGIVNGSTGVVIGGDEHFIEVEFKLEGIIQIPQSYITDDFRGEYLLQHAYAITCHSAQGSEFDTVIIVVENSRLVERSWLYTALTRAKKKVILISTGNNIQSALNRGFSFENISVGFEL